MSTSKKFIPFDQLGNEDAIIVDGTHSKGLILSHWRGVNNHVDIQHDTSTGIVLNALRKNFNELGKQNITATHFDIDGFLGVWSLFNPEIALENENLLKEMSIIGDFRELDLEKPDAERALKLVCWFDVTEKEKFYPPFGTDNSGENETEACVKKFDYFLRNFDNVLRDPDAFRDVWEAEYNKVIKNYKTINSWETKVERMNKIGLITIETMEPVDYYSLFSLTRGFDAVLSIYSNNRYELEYKYTTWVDITSRPTFPRVDFQKLVNQLNEIELSNYQWVGDDITDTGPVLRLGNDDISKSEKFSNPDEREIFPSSIEPEDFKNIVYDFFRKGFSSIKPKRFWTWEEMKTLSK